MKEGFFRLQSSMIRNFCLKENCFIYAGKSFSPEDYNSNGKGKYQQLPLTVLIDEASASASEIFAGAIQDNDRGNIVGRRSFGKGLVQEQRLLPDNSALRLTVARYYVPSGRSIQKPYDEGKEKYYTDIYQRLLHGEFSQKDSIHFVKNLNTRRLVDVRYTVAAESCPICSYPEIRSVSPVIWVEVNRKNQYLYDFTFDFMDRHRQETKNIKVINNY